MAFFCDSKDPLERGRQLAERVRQLVADLDKAWRGKDKQRKQGFGGRLLVTRRHSMYEVHHPGMKVPIQVVVKENLGSLLTESEDYTSIAYFDGEIHFTDRAKFALENFAVPVDVRDKPHRIVKCFQKGFDLILPELDVESLHSRNLKFGLAEVLDLPHLTIVYDSVQGNKIFAEVVEVAKDRGEGGEGGEGDGCSSEEEEEKDQYGGPPGASHLSNVGSIIHHNIRALVRKEHGSFIHYGEDESWETVYSTEVPITERALINSYETVCSRISSRSINLPLIESYFAGDTLEIIDALLVKFYKSSDRKAKSKGVAFSSEAFSKHVTASLESLSDKQIRVAKKAIAALKGTLKLSAVTFKKPRTAYKRRQWYGDYHRKK
mmetsp:Transcript_5617/g.11145  ORF Transcript_5617/g.11145 Transcript_5617/m.11145 type:complete len:378 (-) Transcript_5617:58-1191(-)